MGDWRDEKSYTEAGMAAANRVYAGQIAQAEALKEEAQALIDQLNELKRNEGEAF